MKLNHRTPSIVYVDLYYARNGPGLYVNRRGGRGGKAGEGEAGGLGCTWVHQNGHTLQMLRESGLVKQ